MLQIRRGNIDNLGIIFHIFPQKHMLLPLSLSEMILMRGNSMICCEIRKIIF